MNLRNMLEPVPEPPRQLPPSAHASWHRQILEQHGLLSRAQALALGATPQAIRSQVTAHRWRRVLHNVYATFTGPLPRPARLTAALLYAGAPAMISHRSAAAEWGMLSIEEDEPVHVTVPYSRNAVSDPPQVILHRSRAFKHIASAHARLPMTSRADTIIDLAAMSSASHDARRCFVDLASAAPVSITALSRQLTLRPPYRHRAAMHEALRLVRGGALSALEAEYALEVESAHGLPAGSRQVPFEVDGRTLWEDVTYDSAGAALTVRLDGRAFHSTPGVAFRDRRRDNAAELAGRRRLAYGWSEVHNDPCGVAHEVATVLYRSGWRGRLHPCANRSCQLRRDLRAAS